MNKRRSGWHETMGRLKCVLLRSPAPGVQASGQGDDLLVQQLRRFASEAQPPSTARGRQALMAEVSRQRNARFEQKGRPMIGRLFGARGVALLATAGIFVVGAAT